MFVKWREENKPMTPEESAMCADLRPAWISPHAKRPLTDHRLYAYLAESKRIEGKPRQKIITYLASIPAIYTYEDASDEWKHFWFKVHCSLALAGAGAHIYQNACYEVGKRVQKPSMEELCKIVADEWECYPKWRKDYEVLYRRLSRGYGCFEWVN